MTSHSIQKYYVEPSQHLLNGRVLDLGSKGHKFKTHRMHCVVSLGKTLYLLLSTGSSQEKRKIPRLTETLLTGKLSINTSKTKTNIVFIPLYTNGISSTDQCNKDWIVVFF